MHACVQNSEPYSNFCDFLQWVYTRHPWTRTNCIERQPTPCTNISVSTDNLNQTNLHTVLNSSALALLHAVITVQTSNWFSFGHSWRVYFLVCMCDEQVFSINFCCVNNFMIIFTKATLTKLKTAYSCNSCHDTACIPAWRTGCAITCQAKGLFLIWRRVNKASYSPNQALCLYGIELLGICRMIAAWCRLKWHQNTKMI